MLVRDIGVDAAILDLIDNSVDAALAERKRGRSLADFRVDVRFDGDRFEIVDNCGGIRVEIARDYAFRFGRAPGFNPDSTIGEFGIGMKRAIFRLGREFLVESSTTDSRFVVEVDVDEWRANEDERDWTFPMDVDQTPADESGTRIRIANLHLGVSELFTRDTFEVRILSEIAARHRVVLNDGLHIAVNNTPVELRLYSLLSGHGIVPERQEVDLVSADHPVSLRIIAGIGPPRQSVAESGWNVYCNGRLVLKSDRTELTGWGTGDPEGSTGPPAWHPQYARFRGFVFFESEHPGALPWTTTKDEVDQFSDVYQQALARMRSIIRKYTTYTNELKEERELFEDSDGQATKKIEQAMDRAKTVPVDQVRTGAFSVPERDRRIRPVVPPGPKTTRICFEALLSHVNDLKASLSLRTNRDIGEVAFERLYEEELG